jgi:hypothetical protein
LQAFQKAFTPTGGVTMLPQPIHLTKIKDDDSNFPDQIESSYAGFLAGTGVDRKDWPVVRWWIEEVMLKQLVEDIDNWAFKAVYVAPTPGTAGAASGALHGFRKVIQDLVADTNSGINVIATGALNATPATFVGQIEAFVEGMDPDYRNSQEIVIAMSHTLANRFKKGMRTLYNVNYSQSADLMALIDYPNIKVMGQNAMSGSNKIFATHKANLLRPTKRNGVEVVVEGRTREVLAYHDHLRGYGVVDPRLFYTNDLENT